MSLFYRERYSQRFPVSLLALERLHHLQRTEPPEDAIIEVLVECCGIKEPTQDDFIYLLERIDEVNRECDSKPPPSGYSTQDKKGLGSDFNKFISSLPLDQIILWMVQFDHDKARKLYCEVDRTTVMQAVKDFSTAILEGNKFLFEAVLYGFGGSYKGDSSDDAEVIDLSKQENFDGLQALFRAH